MSDEALEALDRIAKEHRSTVSGVVEAAGRLLRDGGPGAEELKLRIRPDMRAVVDGAIVGQTPLLIRC